MTQKPVMTQKPSTVPARPSYSYRDIPPHPLVHLTGSARNSQFARINDQLIDEYLAQKTYNRAPLTSSYMRDYYAPSLPRDDFLASYRHVPPASKDPSFYYYPGNQPPINIVTIVNNNK
jgi:hypothetical protein